MGSVAAGQVVFLPYPFSDLTDSKLRPVVVLAKGSRSDWIVCQVTSNPHGDPRSFVLPQGTAFLLWQAFSTKSAQTRSRR